MTARKLEQDLLKFEELKGNGPDDSRKRRVLAHDIVTEHLSLLKDLVAPKACHEEQAIRRGEDPSAAAYTSDLAQISDFEYFASSMKGSMKGSMKANEDADFHKKIADVIRDVYDKAATTVTVPRTTVTTTGVITSAIDALNTGIVTIKPSVGPVGGTAIVFNGPGISVPPPPPYTLETPEEAAERVKAVKASLNVCNWFLKPYEA